MMLEPSLEDPQRQESRRPRGPSRLENFPSWLPRQGAENSFSARIWRREDGASIL